MKFLILLLTSIVLNGCDQLCPKCPEPNESLIIGFNRSINTGLLKKEFEKGVPVQKVWTESSSEKSQIYLLRRGFDENKNCFLSRSPLHVSEIEGVNVVMLRMKGVTETCKGKGCSHCAFKDGGGCECKGSTNTCEHIITRNIDILKLE